jgi:putative ubiquitin-RnfH superfamily antitoxin RatB of RatAB toxin-antitoxin module
MDRPEPPAEAYFSVVSSSHSQSLIQVSLVRSPGPREVQEWLLDLPEGSTVMDALQACGLLPVEPTALAELSLGIWGRRCKPAQTLRQGDRVEVYRSLRVDPKVARRQRFEGQGVRRAGLFAKRRPGAKPGY